MDRRSFIEKTASAIAALSLAGVTTGFTNKELQYRILGKTGLKVSLIGLGGYHIGHRRITDEESVTLIRKAIDEGINFLDNAWEYNGGRSEILMGKALRDGYREKVILMTKHHGREPETARKHLEESLERLQTDYLDVWQFHEMMRLEEVEKIYSSGVLDFAQKMKKEGKIRFIGFTGHANPKVHAAMLEKGFEWDTIQMPVNVLDHHYLSFSQEIIPKVKEKNMGIIAMKTLAGTPGVIVKNNIASISECLHFAMTLPVSTVVSGIDTLDYLKENLEIARNFSPLTESQLVTLLEKTLQPSADGKFESYKRTEI